MPNDYSESLLLYPPSIMPKSDTPIKPTIKVASVLCSKGIPISNEDLMAAVKSFKGEVLSNL